MRKTALFSALLLAVFSLAAVAQEQAKAPAADSFRQEALVFEKYETTTRMHADGTGERVVHVLMRIQSEAAARQFSVLVFSFAAATETPHIKMVRVHKPDGRTVETPATDAIDMAAPVTREAPLYSDLKEKHLPVRSLSAGDTLEYEVSTDIEKTDAHGQFWGSTHFTAPGAAVVLAEIFTLEVPKDKYVQVWSPNHKPTITEQDGVRTYTWNVAQLVPTPKKAQGDESIKPKLPKDPDEDAEGRKLPSVAWTTFHNWAEVGDWYRSLALTRTQPTDSLRARADEITKDAKIPGDQIRALYAFVSMRTRYVGIDFGIGRYQPHAAAEILANQYGDCKDKDTLLEALLKTKGFSTAPALIGAGIALVPSVPTPSAFNHVITTVNLPDGRIWLDSTPEVAPYRLLTQVIRDQQALVVPTEGAATLEITPAAPPYSLTARFEADGTLDAEGKLTSKMTATYRDDDEIVVRALARGIAPAEWDKASQYVSSMTGFGGTTSNTQFANVEDLSTPIKLTYDYSRHPFGDWDNRRILPLFPALEFTALDKDNSEPEKDIELGAPRTLIAVTRIKLPEGYHTDLPDPIHVKTDFATFDKTYHFDGNEIVAERDIVVLQKKLSKSEWKQYQKFTKDISLDGEPWIQLIRPRKDVAVTVTKVSPEKTTTAANNNKTKSAQLSPEVTIKKSETQPSKPSVTQKPAEELSDDTPVTELMRNAYQQLQAGNWDAARIALDKVKAKNPEEQLLWGSYGIIAMMKMDYDEAKKDFQKELDKHPDNVGMVAMLAETQQKSGDSAQARTTLKNFLNQHPEELRLSLILASMQTSAEDYAGALKTLQSAAEHNPDDLSVRLRLSDTLFHLKRKDEAAAAAKSVIDGTEEPLQLNDAAYTLAQTGLDLSYAEAASRKSISKLEEQSATITTSEVNSKAFNDSNLLVAAWDTLGWILYREGKFENAKPLLVAAWRNTLRAEVGDHLGQLYEAMKQNDEAAAIYALADAAMTENIPHDIRQHIKTSLVRLKAAGAKPGSQTGVSDLQNSRTYSIQRPANVSGWGAFRLEITAAGVIESQQMSGEHQLSGIEKSISATKFPDLIPPGSKAHLLRSGVISCTKSAGKTCDLVLVPEGGLQTEQQ